MRLFLLSFCLLLTTCAVETPHLSFPLGKTGLTGYIYAGAGITQDNSEEGQSK